ncbi:hypothetical protein CH366_15985 [Leptospira harrisiae]|nr:hypothetical protein CH366_15985 [Leptospira harrisiae]
MNLIRKDLTRVNYKKLHGFIKSMKKLLEQRKKTNLGKIEFGKPQNPNFAKISNDLILASVS